MTRPISWPIALSIAGSDSGGGAGIQADLKTFAALRVHGTVALSCVTAQNPARVSAVHPLPPAVVTAQITAVADELPPAAIKTGMLYSAAIMQAVAAALESVQGPLVVDPVMIASSGVRLLRASAVQVLLRLLLPRAFLVTPNLPEAEALLGSSIQTPEDMREAARQLSRQIGCAVLIKGGHLEGASEAIDILAEPGGTETLFSSPFFRRGASHGTGCTYSAAITAFLAHGFPLLAAVEHGKSFIANAIARSIRIQNHLALNPLEAAPPLSARPPRNRSKRRHASGQNLDTPGTTPGHSSLEKRPQKHP